MKKFRQVLRRATDFIEIYAEELVFGVAMALLLGILILGLMFANTQIKPEEPTGASQAQTTLHAVQSIAIFEVLEYEVFEKGLSVKTCFISYSVNGIVTGVNFKNIKEVRIFVAYLHTLGDVNYLLDHKLESYLERD